MREEKRAAAKAAAEAEKAKKLEQYKAAIPDDLSEDSDDEAEFGLDSPTQPQQQSSQQEEDGEGNHPPPHVQQAGRLLMVPIYAILFVIKLRNRAAGSALPPDECLVMLGETYDLAASWLRSSVKTVVQSILSDNSLAIDLSGAQGNAAGAVAKGIGGGFGFRKGSKDKKAAAEDVNEKAKSNPANEAQAKKLKVRAKALLEALLGAVPEAPPALLHRLHFLCQRRVHWPPEPNTTLFVSERSALRHQPKDGSYCPSTAAGSPPRLAVGLILTRVLLHQMLL